MFTKESDVIDEDDVFLFEKEYSLPPLPTKNSVQLIISISDTSGLMYPSTASDIYFSFAFENQRQVIGPVRAKETLLFSPNDNAIFSMTPELEIPLAPFFSYHKSSLYPPSSPISLLSRPYTSHIEFVIMSTSLLAPPHVIGTCILDFRDCLLFGQCRKETIVVPVGAGVSPDGSGGVYGCGTVSVNMSLRDSGGIGREMMLRWRHKAVHIDRGLASSSSPPKHISPRPSKIPSSISSEQSHQTSSQNIPQTQVHPEHATLPATPFGQTHPGFTRED
ncbi:hypothetical protein ADUPG1_012781, partial [Aduncisulcus paluster]